MVQQWKRIHLGQGDCERTKTGMMKCLQFPPFFLPFPFLPLLSFPLIFLPSFPSFLPFLSTSPTLQTLATRLAKTVLRKYCSVVYWDCTNHLKQSRYTTRNNHQLWLVAKRRKLLPNPKQQEHLSCYPIKLWPCLNCHLLFICSLRHVSGIQPQTSIWITYHFVVADLKPLISTWLF